MARLQHEEGSEDGIKKPHVHTAKEGDTKGWGGDVKKKNGGRKLKTEGGSLQEQHGGHPGQCD